MLFPRRTRIVKWDRKQEGDESCLELYLWLIKRVGFATKLQGHPKSSYRYTLRGYHGKKTTRVKSINPQNEYILPELV